MTRQMYMQVDIFRDEVDKCLNLVDQNLDFDLRSILFPEPEKESYAQEHIHQTVIAQPALFVVEYALAKVLNRLGVTPFSMLGHSVSEYVAACLAGVFSLKTAIEIVVKRGQLAQEMPEGAMLAVALPESEVVPLLNSRIAFASTIGRSQCVVSGFPDSIEALYQRLDSQGVICKKVRVTRAFHSMMLDPILEEFRAFVAQRPINAPQMKYISGVTGSWIDAKEVQSTQYWVDQLRNPVRFYEGITELSKVEHSLFLEVGKGGMLSSMVKAHPLISEEIQCLLTCPPSYLETEDVPFFLQTLGNLSSSGIAVDKTPLKLEDRVNPSREQVQEITPGNTTNNEPIMSPKNIEQQVHQHFCYVLGIKEIGPQQNFLESGGNSLMAMQVISRLRKSLEVAIPIKEFFANPTLEGVSAYLEKHQRDKKIKKVKPVGRDQSKGGRIIKPVANSGEVSSIKKKKKRSMEFSLIFFSSDENAFPDDRYKLVMQGAQFADKNDFDAVWIPERHFNKFGGLYPNPSVLAAAIVSSTKNIHVRGGSVVAPLHHPVRIAEEWSVVDNLSQGRCGVSFGSGFHPKDFILAPAAFPNRKEIMFENIKHIKQLWKGGTYEGPAGGDERMTVELFPKPYSNELPIWLSTTRSKDTFREAGELGANVLTALLRLSIPELKERISIYRDALENAGHDPQAGVVTLMLHTFVGPNKEFVIAHAQQPLKDYLRSHMEHTVAVSQEKTDGNKIELSVEEKEELLDHAFERYSQENSLIGTEDSCLPMISKLIEVGVNEVACLIDFGVDFEALNISLDHLNDLKETVNKGRKALS